MQKIDYVLSGEAVVKVMEQFYYEVHMLGILEKSRDQIQQNIEKLTVQAELLFHLGILPEETWKHIMDWLEEQEREGAKKWGRVKRSSRPETRRGSCRQPA